MNNTPIYVVVGDNDKPYRPGEVPDPDGAIVYETYLKNATLETAQQRAAQLDRFGACRIARLVFEDEEAFKP